MGGPGPDDHRKKKMKKTKALLDAHPTMREALMQVPKGKRPTLQEFLGWSNIITHRKQELTKAAFHDALGIAEARVEAMEKETIDAIKAARAAAGDTDATEFLGGTWGS